MIRQDRLELNERFLKVFQLLQERGDVVMNDRNGKGMGDFAEKILGNRAYGHIVRAFLNKGDRRVIDYHQARAVCREYNVNEAYLVDGIGTPFGFDLPKSLSGPGAPKGNILFTTIAAFAGSGVEATGGQAVEDNLYYAIPGISGSGLVAFPIEGNSMEPQIMHMDTIICREIAGVHDIKDNEIYAVKSNGSMWVKHVQKIENERGQVTALRLISTNHFEYDPFEEDVTPETRLYKVIKRICNV